MIRLTIRQLEYFLALAETLHFGRAAEVVGVTQPALSAQIAELETRLGCRLFERGRGTVALTDEARALLPRIERLIQELHEVETAASTVRAPMTGRVRLGIIPTVAPYLLPAIFSAVGERFPSLHLEVREAVTQVLLEEARTRRLDVILAAGPLNEPMIETAPLFEDRFLLAVPESDAGFIAPPVAPESRELERLILLEEGHCMRDQALAICGTVKPATMASFGATSLTTLMQMVAHGLGLTLVPEIAAETARTLPGLRLVPFAAPAPSRHLVLGWQRRTTRQADYLGLAEAIHALAPQEALD